MFLIFDFILQPLAFHSFILKVFNKFYFVKYTQKKRLKESQLDIKEHDEREEDFSHHKNINFKFKHKVLLCILKKMRCISLNKFWPEQERVFRIYDIGV